MPDGSTYGNLLLPSGFQHIQRFGPSQSALAQFNAQQQSQSDLLSGLFGLGSSGILAAGEAGGFGKLFGCWIAREVYGADNPKWLVVRQWLFTRAPKWLLRLYLKYGERFALWLHGKDRIKAVIRWWMDARIREMLPDHSGTRSNPCL